jgi:hypothetical protein
MFSLSYHEQRNDHQTAQIYLISINPAEDRLEVDEVHSGAISFEIFG